MPCRSWKVFFICIENVSFHICMQVRDRVSELLLIPALLVLLTDIDAVVILRILCINASFFFCWPRDS